MQGSEQGFVLVPSICSYGLLRACASEREAVSWHPMSTSLRPMENSLLFQTNMLVHIWLLSIHENVNLSRLLMVVTYLLCALPRVEMLKCLVIPWRVLAPFGICLIWLPYDVTLWCAQEKLGIWRLSNSFRLLRSNEIHCSCVRPQWKWKSYLPTHS